jgi:PAS domain S-box-containing protein
MNSVKDTDMVRLEKREVRPCNQGETAIEPGAVKNKIRNPLQNRMDISQILDALPFYVLLVDENHTILQANSKVQEHLGVDPKKVIGGYCPRVIHGVDGPFEGCPLEEVVEKGHAVEREVFDQETGHWILSAIYPTESLTPEGHKVFFHMVTDITDRRRAQEQLKTSHEKLRRLSAGLESLREEERKKIALDLHDETSQLLASLNAHLEVAISMLPANEDKIKTRLRNAQSISVNIIEQLQRIIYELRPLVLDDLGLLSAIGWLVSNMKTAGIKVNFKTTGRVRRLDRQIETTVFRVTQEAINNIIRHAHATRAGINLRFLKRAVSVRVRDDGSGFNMEEALNSREGLRGLGLLGMRERVELLNGDFDLISEPDKGSRISFKIPLSSTALGNSGTHKPKLPRELYAH